MVAAASIQDALNAPMQTAQIYINDRNATDKTAFPIVAPSDLLLILKRWNKILLQMQREILRLDKTAATAIHAVTQAQHTLFLQQLEKINAIETSTTNKKEHAILNEIKSIFNNLGVIFDDIDMIATADEVDENSLEFQAFMVDLAHQATLEGKRTFGKEALFALFD